MPKELIKNKDERTERKEEANRKGKQRKEQLRREEIKQ